MSRKSHVARKPPETPQFPPRNEVFTFVEFRLIDEVDDDREDCPTHVACGRWLGVWPNTGAEMIADYLSGSTLFIHDREIVEKRDATLDEMIECRQACQRRYVLKEIKNATTDMMEEADKWDPCWTQLELRQLICDSFRVIVTEPLSGKRSKERREFESYCLANNLP